MTLASASGFCGPNDLEGKKLRITEGHIRRRILRKGPRNRPFLFVPFLSLDWPSEDYCKIRLNHQEKEKTMVTDEVPTPVENINSPAALTEKGAATYLAVSPQFLRLSRHYGNRPGHAEGPPFIRLGGGRAIRYLISGYDFVSPPTAPTQKSPTTTATGKMPNRVWTCAPWSWISSRHCRPMRCG